MLPTKFSRHCTMPKQPKPKSELTPKPEKPSLFDLMKGSQKVIIWIMIVTFLLSVVASAFM
jgi:hypothetical protein